jgi:hypothetical protein
MYSRPEPRLQSHSTLIWSYASSYHGGQLMTHPHRTHFADGKIAEMATEHTFHATLHLAPLFLRWRSVLPADCNLGLRAGWGGGGLSHLDYRISHTRVVLEHQIFRTNRISWRAFVPNVRLSENFGRITAPSQELAPIRRLHKGQVRSQFGHSAMARECRSQGAFRPPVGTQHLKRTPDCHEQWVLTPLFGQRN